MNYTYIYQSLIDKYKTKTLVGYYELHHIVPKCIGGSNDKSNLVKLPARVHFVAHLLLAKIYGGSLIHAAFRMSNYNKYNNKKYEWLRKVNSKRVSDANIGRVVSKETRIKIAETRRKNGGYIFSSETRKKMADAHKGNSYNRGRIVTKEIREKISLAMSGDKHPNFGKDFSGKNNPFFGRKHSEETKQKARDRNVGKKYFYKKRCPRTDAYKKLRSEHNKKIGLRPPPQFGNQVNKGRVWVVNKTTQKNHLIKKDDIYSYLNNGFEFGRTKVEHNIKVS